MQPNAPVIPPAQVAFVLTVVGLIVLAFVCMLVLKVAIFLAEKRAGVEYRWEPPAPREIGPIRRWMESHAAEVEARYTPRRYVAMSSWEDGGSESVSDLVCIPVSNTGMDQSGMERATPDMDAERNEMPRLSRDITATDELALLCVIRNPDGKHRHSANDIYKFVGGDRNTVLATIRALRDVPPVPEFRQENGETTPASYPVSGQHATR